MRVIAGSLRGRDLGEVPKGVRPTSDRVRESLFSVLGSVDDARVLDLFAGTGALGLEALSRGARDVLFIDQSRRVAVALKKRIERLGLETDARLEIRTIEAGKALKRLATEPERQFDLVFVDPPYEKGDRNGILNLLFSGPSLSDEAVVVVERPTRHALAPIVGSKEAGERRYGETTLTWLERASPKKR